MSRKQTITLFIDWSVSQKIVPEALRRAGASVEVHADHFAIDTPDTDWLPAVSERGWIVITKDFCLNSNFLELRAIAKANARVFILSSGNFTGQQMAGILVQGLDSIQKFVQGNQAPFIAKVDLNSRITIWRNRTQLQKLLKSR